MPVLRARNAVPSGAKATEVASETWSIAFTSAKPVGSVGFRSSGPSSAASWAAAAIEFSHGVVVPVVRERRVAGEHGREHGQGRHQRDEQW